MKKIIGLSLLVLFVTGCSTTPSAMRTQAPDVIEVSQKNSKDIAICIAEKWEQHGVVNQRETNKGYSLTATVLGKLHYLADIEENQGKTTIKAYKYLQYSPAKNPLLSAVTECQI